MKIHKLKTLPEYWWAVNDGTKTFEVRKNDRDFQVGDYLIMVYYDPSPDFRTDQEFFGIEVSYVLNGGQFGVDPDYCILGIKPLDAEGHRLCAEWMDSGQH